MYDSDMYIIVKVYNSVKSLEKMSIIVKLLGVFLIVTCVNGNPFLS